jgi:hypothetical protein
MIDETDHFGCLVINGKSPTAKQLTSIVGGSEREIARLLGELEAAGVFSRAGHEMPPDVAPLVPNSVPRGAVISRRMLRDKAREQVDRVNGAKGGNPDLIGKTLPSDPHEGKTEGLTPGDKAPRARSHSQHHSHSQAVAAASAYVEGHHAQTDEQRGIETINRVIVAAGYDPAKWVGDCSIVRAWLNAGHDPDLDILPAVAEVVARPGNKGTKPLTYFTGKIEERRLARTGGRTDSAPATARTAFDRARDHWLSTGCLGREPRREDYEAAA